MSSTINFNPLPKQFTAYQYLTDNETTEILFGGSIGGGKSKLAVAYLIINCLQYPGTRYLLGRSELKNLKQTTLQSFFDNCKEWGLDEQYTFNKIDNIITWTNGSQIILKDLKQSPSDPNFISLGSAEYTAAVIDEASEISEQAYTVIKTRLRYKLNEYNLIPKLLICSNPSKGWLYSGFYKPSIEGTLPVHKKFIQSLPKDNHHLPTEYVNSLTPQNLGQGFYNTLVLGNWDYATTDFDLFDSDALMNSFYINSPTPSNHKYISIDPASTGKDSTVISVWFGYDCIKIVKLLKNDTLQVTEKVKELMNSYNVKITNVIIDKVGVGTGIYDLLKGCVGFVANASPLNGEPFQHLKSQLFFKFAQLINTGQIGLTDSTYRDDIIQQLEAHKRFNIEKDGRAEVTPKSVVKQMIGKSPDFADALVMRMYFEYKKASLPLWY